MRTPPPPVRRLLLFAFLAGTSALVATAAAQAPAGPPADTLRLPTVSVTAARVAVSAAEAPARVAVLGRADAEAAGAHSLADLLEARTGLFIRRYGPGGLASASLRGTTASQTLVLLDGHRIADPQLGQLDLSLLPAVLFERAEVLYGPGAALYGTDGVGGVVDLQTGDGPPGVTAELRGGSFGARGGSVLARTAGPLAGARAGVLAVADVEVYAGDYAYFDSTRFDNATGRPGLWVAREDTDERRASALGRGWFEAGRLRSSAGVWGATAERGLFTPGAGRGQRQWDQSLRVWTDHTLRLGATTLHAGALAQRGLLAWAGGPTAAPDSGRTATAGAHVRAERPVRVGAGVWTVTAGAQAGRARARHPGLTTGASERSSALFASAVAEHGRVRLYPALRLDAVRTVGDGVPAGTLVAWSPALGANVRAAGPVYVKASVRRAFRAPTFNDRFWRGAGDPGLLPERAGTADAGIHAALGTPRLGVDAELTHFRTAARDQIVWRPGPDAVWRPANVGRVRTAGWEGSLGARAPRPAGAGLRLDLVATRTGARDRSDPAASTYDRPLLYVPDRQVKAALSVGGRHVGIDGEAVHTGRRFTAADGSASLGPVTVWAAGLRLGHADPTGAVALAVRVENLTGRRYEVVRGYPMPPRHLALRLSITTR